MITRLITYLFYLLNVYRHIYTKRKSINIVEELREIVYVTFLRTAFVNFVKK